MARDRTVSEAENPPLIEQYADILLTDFRFQEDLPTAPIWRSFMAMARSCGYKADGQPVSVLGKPRKGFLRMWGRRSSGWFQR
jgi:hypothetical protein